MKNEPYVIQKYFTMFPLSPWTEDVIISRKITFEFMNTFMLELNFEFFCQKQALYFGVQIYCVPTLKSS